MPDLNYLEKFKCFRLMETLHIYNTKKFLLFIERALYYFSVNKVGKTRLTISNSIKLGEKPDRFIYM